MLENTPKVLFAPESRSALKAGFDQMARLLAQTMGPSQGIVLHSTVQKPIPER